MAFNQSDLTKLSAKVLAANVISSNPSKQWYEASLANNNTVDPASVWVEMKDVRELHGANIAACVANAIANPKLIEVFGYSAGGAVNDATAVRLTPVSGTLGHDWLLTDTYGDTTTTKRNIISPTLIPQPNGRPSSGYSVRLFRGLPSLGNEIITVEGFDGSEVGWFFSASNSLAMFAADIKPAQTDEIYAVGFQYVGNTLEGGSTDYNAHNEYTLASVSPDETLHLEDGDIFMTEKGEAIVFETHRLADENVYASAPENQFFLEGMVPLVDETGEAIHMESADSWRHNLLDGYFGKRTWTEWSELWQSEGSAQEDVLFLLGTLMGNHVEMVFGGNERYLNLKTPSAVVFIKDGGNSFTIANHALQPWSAINRTYVILEEGHIYSIQTPSRGYSFRRTNIGGFGWTVTNLSTGGSHAFNTIS